MFTRNQDIEDELFALDAIYGPKEFRVSRNQDSGSLVVSLDITAQFDFPLDIEIYLSSPR